MLKSKERRDTVLLGFMATIMAVFLLYVFIPSGKKKPEVKIPDNKPIQEIKPEEKKEVVEEVIPDSPAEVKEEPEDNRHLLELDQYLKTQLQTIYSIIVDSPVPFAEYDTESLEASQTRFENLAVERLFKFSFRDLSRIADMEFPAAYNKSLKFNLYLSLFLIKLKEEGVTRSLSELSQAQFQEIVDFSGYRLLENEVDNDYYALPVLFYFQQLINRSNIYPWLDYTSFFTDGIKDLRDLTESKYIEKIRVLLGFSFQRELYRINWVEHDGFGPDDKETYNNVPLKTYCFLKQEYLVFPDLINPDNNRWLCDLLRSDSGDIELLELKARSEEPSRNLQLQKIIYTPLNAQFVFLLKEYTPVQSMGFPERILGTRMIDFHNSYNVIPVAEYSGEEGPLRAAMERFGIFLKKNRSAIPGESIE